MSLPCQRLLDAVIRNMKLRLMDGDIIKSRNNAQETNRIHELLNIVNPDSWNIDEVVVPWKAAEEKLDEFYEQFHHKICVNDFRDYVENVIRNYDKIPITVQKA